MQEKASKYLVVSDNTYRDRDGLRTRIVYATRTAKVLFVLPEVADALAEGDVDALSPGTLNMLREAEAVVPAEEDELTAVLDRNRATARDESSRQFILMPTSYCNMGCKYCGQQHERGGVSADHRDHIRERVLRVIRRPTTKRVRVDWFGAEPMMGYAVIRDLAKDFTRVADEQGVEYYSEMITNGSLLSPRKIAELVHGCRLRKFCITLDGPADVHDVHRPLKGGGRSFAKIAATVLEVVRDPAYQHVVFEFRTNVDIHNQDRIEEYIGQMAELGFARPNVYFSIFRVRPWSNDTSALEIEKREYADREVGWLRQMQDRGLRFFPMPTVANRVVCPAVQPTSELISGKGSVFSCTDQPLVPELEDRTALGHVSDPDLPLIRPKGLYDDWNDSVAAGQSGCRTCLFLPTCGGMCPKLWTEGYIPCPSYKFNAQGRLDLAASRVGFEPVATG